MGLADPEHNGDDVVGGVAQLPQVSHYLVGSVYVRIYTVLQHFLNQQGMGLVTNLGGHKGCSFPSGDFCVLKYIYTIVPTTYTKCSGHQSIEMSSETVFVQLSNDKLRHILYVYTAVTFMSIIGMQLKEKVNECGETERWRLESENGNKIGVLQLIQKNNINKSLAVQR